MNFNYKEMKRNVPRYKLGFKTNPRFPLKKTTAHGTKLITKWIKNIILRDIEKSGFKEKVDITIEFQIVVKKGSLMWEKE